MEMMLSILRAAYCQSTHHYLAIDSLRQVGTRRGERLRDVLLKHHAQYLQGAKDPDTRFRDFHNHVIHVADHHWGGADEAAEQWRQRAIGFLKEQKWSDAAYAIGVLSHYFMDPFQPLHTAQSPQESIVHRPMEWSICCAYETLYQMAQDPQLSVSFTLGNEPDWLQKAIYKGAELAYRYYLPLIEDYDMSCCTSSPPDALSHQSRELIAEIIAVVLCGWARVVERIAEEADADIPAQPLTVPALVAGIKMPAAWITRRISNAQERQAVKALFEEYQQTGTVQQHLPDEVRQVKATRQADREAGRLPAENKPVTPQAKTSTALLAEPITDNRPDTLRMPAPRLTLDSELVDAPSIGPKTAERFSQIGVHTVRAFLNTNAEDLSQRLRTKWITVDLVREWQNQCRLACSIGGLKAASIQILVGVGIYSAEDLARAAPTGLIGDVRNYCETSAGRRVLRGSEAPNAAEITGWIEAAKRQANPSQKKGSMLQSAS